MTYLITTTFNGKLQTHLIEATRMPTAISSSLELADPGAVLVSCLREGEW